MPPTPFAYKMNGKLKKKTSMPFTIHAMLEFGEKNHKSIDANTQRPLWLEGQTCPLGINCNKRPSLTQITIVTTTSQNIVAHKTKYIRMMMLANVWTPSMKPTMSTNRCESLNAMAKECGSTHVKQKMLHLSQ
jgi:hypothetical protein